MKIAYLTTTLNESIGWGRYAAGFLAEAKRRNGAIKVIAPDPERLRSRDIRWHQPFTALLDAFMLQNELKDCEVIHAAVEPSAPTVFFLSLLLQKPYIVSVHGTYADLRVYSKAIRWLYRLSFSRASRIVAVSRYTADVARREIPNRSVTIVPGGFTLPPQTKKRERNSGNPRILAVGAFKPRKGFHTLVEALGLLKKDRLTFHADIIGPRDATQARDQGGRLTYFERVQARVIELGLTEQLTFHGRVNEEVLDRFYADADLFVLPSEHDGKAFEGLGLVYLDALARGLPVIGCLDSGAEDVIQDGLNGRLVPPGQPEKLAEAIREILGDPEKWKRMSDIGPESIDRFRWEKVGADMEDVYKAAIEAYVR